MNELIFARRRYADLRRELDIEHETDRVLHEQLTRAIRALENKILAIGEGPSASADRPDRETAARPADRDRSRVGSPSR